MEVAILAQVASVVEVASAVEVDVLLVVTKKASPRAHLSAYQQL